MLYGCMSDKGARLILGEIPLSEEDVKIRFITPALERAGWFKERMRTEVSLTDGRVLLSGNKPGRGAKKRADYLLWHHPNANPIAVVEAKGADALPSFGLQQAIGYAKLCGASFAYASNGQAFEEYDLLTGQERELPMEAFPSPEALHKRFLAHGDGGNPLSAAEAGLLCEPYYVSATKPKTPRCYQRCAVTNAPRPLAKASSSPAGKTASAAPSSPASSTTMRAKARTRSQTWQFSSCPPSGALALGGPAKALSVPPGEYAGNGETQRN